MGQIKNIKLHIVTDIKHITNKNVSKQDESFPESFKTTGSLISTTQQQQQPPPPPHLSQKSFTHHTTQRSRRVLPSRSVGRRRAGGYGCEVRSFVDETGTTSEE